MKESHFEVLKKNIASNKIGIEVNGNESNFTLKNYTKKSIYFFFIISLILIALLITLIIYGQLLFAIVAVISIFIHYQLQKKHFAINNEILFDTVNRKLFIKHFSLKKFRQVISNEIDFSSFRKITTKKFSISRNGIVQEYNEHDLTYYISVAILTTNGLHKILTISATKYKKIDIEEITNLLTKILK